MTCTCHTTARRQCSPPTAATVTCSPAAGTTICPPWPWWATTPRSVADEHRNDPTTRWLITFAKDSGHGALTLANQVAGVATDPADLATMADPIGPQNDYHLQTLAEDHHLIVLAWGAAADPQRARTVASRLWRTLRHTGGTLAVFGWTAAGHPRHPLYLPRGTQLQCLTATAAPDYTGVDPRWCQLIADTTALDPPPTPSAQTARIRHVR